MNTSLSNVVFNAGAPPADATDWPGDIQNAIWLRVYASVCEAWSWSQTLELGPAASLLFPASVGLYRSASVVSKVIALWSEPPLPTYHGTMS